MQNRLIDLDMLLLLLLLLLHRLLINVRAGIRKLEQINNAFGRIRGDVIFFL